MKRSLSETASLCVFRYKRYVSEATRAVCRYKRYVSEAVQSVCRYKRYVSEAVRAVCRFKGNSRGASSVFLCMMLMGLILLAGLFSDAILRAATISSLGRTSQLAARSLLSEYDIHLFEDYGLFALISDEETAAEKIKMYVTATADIKGQAGKLDVFGLDQINADIDFKAYSLLGLDSLEKQIVQNMKYKVVLNALGLPTESSEIKSQIDPYIEIVAEGRSKLSELEKEAEEGEREAQALQNEREASVSRSGQKSKEIAESHSNQNKREASVSRSGQKSKEIAESHSNQNKREASVSRSGQNSKDTAESSTHSEQESTESAEQAKAKQAFDKIKKQSEIALHNAMRNNSNIRADSSNGSERGASTQSGGSDGGTNTDEIGTLQNDMQGNRTLRNSSVIEALPSWEAGLCTSWTSKLLGGADLLKDAFSSENDAFCQFKELTGDMIEGAVLNEYIIKYCNNKLKDNYKMESFFKNEVEYILYGNLNDADNYSKFKERFLILRAGLNLLHIYNDSAKREETLKMANVIAPGPGAAAVQLIIATAWAAAEAAEDLKTIEEKGKVPIFKTNGTWKLSLTGLAENKVDTSGTQSKETGLDYDGYLRLFLVASGREQKLLRLMDIIQINMKGRYYTDFAIKSCYSGFQMTVQCKRRNIGLMPPIGGSSWISAVSSHAY